MAKLCEHRDIFGHCTEQPDDIFVYAIPSSNIFNVPPIPPLPPQPPQPVNPNKKPENREEDEIKTRAYRIPKIKTVKMTETDRMKAKLARAAMINKTEGIEQARNYLNDNGLDTYKIDRELSTRDALVIRNAGISDADVMAFINRKETVTDEELVDYINSNNNASDAELMDYLNNLQPTTGETVTDADVMDFINTTKTVSDMDVTDFINSNDTVSDAELMEFMSKKAPVEYKVVFAGTDIKNVSDVQTDAEILAGRNSQNIQQMNEARDLIRNATERYGIPPDELIGFSLGGNKAITIGAELRIPSTTFNPLIGDEIVRAGRVFGDHTIVRTPTDPASLNIARGKNNFIMKNIDVIDTRLDPTDSHTLRHFIDEPVEGKGKMSDSVIDAIHPTNLVGGLFAAFAGEELADKIDPNGAKNHAVAHQALAGSLTGVMTSTGAAALAGEGLTMTALLPEVVAGTVGFATASAVTSAIARDMAGENKTTVGVVSNVVGGASGGASAAAAGGLVAVGVSVASGAMTGAEVGSALAPETFGLSIVAGAALGAVIGAGAYGVSKISPSVGHSVNQQVVKPVETSINNAANDAARGISKGAKAVGKWFSGR